jgi:hypothetical protein
MKPLNPPRTILTLLIVIGLAICLGFVSGAFFHRNQPFPYRYLAALVPDQQGLRPEYDHRATHRCIDKISDSSAIPVARVLVVGHAYGSPGGNNRGVDNNLIEFLASSGDHWDLMALTGDIVSNASRHNLTLAHNQLSPYADQLAVAPGNHDVGKTSDNARRDVFGDVFGVTYSAIELADDLLIFIDLNVGWTLDLPQRQWLEDLLVDGDKYSRIIVFSHELVWGNYVGADVLPNGYTSPRTDAPDFAELLNLFDAISSPMMFVAGDIGSGNNPGLYCGTKDGVHYLANGLGGNSDHLIELTLREHGVLTIHPIELGS